MKDKLNRFLLKDEEKNRAAAAAAAHASEAD